MSNTQTLTSSQQKRLEISLLLLRLGVFIVMLMWTLDKILYPDHAGKVFSHFYGLHDMQETALLLIAIAELILLALFISGIKKRISYGLVLLFHGISTLSSYKQYMAPFDNLLFFAAWPMLAACVALYLLRDLDRLFTAPDKWS